MLTLCLPKRTQPLLVAACCLLLMLISVQSWATEKPAMADWVVDTHDGQRLSLYNELSKGNKVVVIFWATWCRYCRALMPELNKLYRSGTHHNATFVAINIWEDGDPIAYMAKNDMEIPVALKGESIAQNYKVFGTPAVFVIDQNQQILYQRRAGNTVEHVIAGIKTALSN